MTDWSNFKYRDWLVKPTAAPKRAKLSPSEKLMAGLREQLGMLRDPNYPRTIVTTKRGTVEKPIRWYGKHTTLNRVEARVMYGKINLLPDNSVFVSGTKEELIEFYEYCLDSAQTGALKHAAEAVAAQMAARAQRNKLKKAVHLGEATPAEKQEYAAMLNHG